MKNITLGVSTGGFRKLLVCFTATTTTTSVSRLYNFTMTPEKATTKIKKIENKERRSYFSGIFVSK